MSSTGWQHPKGWCAVYAILQLARIHGFVIPEISSEEDLSRLRQEWEELIQFTKYDIDVWPGMRGVLVRGVLKHVYMLQVIPICQCRFHKLRYRPRASTFQQRLKHRSLRQLARFNAFNKRDGVGILFCENAEHEHHAMHFKIEQTNVFFFDTGGHNRDACWIAQRMDTSIVNAVYLVKPVAIE